MCFPICQNWRFFGEKEDAVVKELKTLDLDTYNPGSACEALGPKSRYGFRIVTSYPSLILWFCSQQLLKSER